MLVTVAFVAQAAVRLMADPWEGGVRPRWMRVCTPNGIEWRRQEELDEPGQTEELKEELLKEEEPELTVNAGNRTSICVSCAPQ